MAKPEMYYHAHVYFVPATESQARQLFSQARTDLTALQVQVHGLIPRPIGPHPVGMFEMDFRASAFKEVTQWLETKRKGLSVLIHENTGDDYRDHTDGATWLGTELELNLDCL